MWAQLQNNNINTMYPADCHLATCESIEAVGRKVNSEIRQARCEGDAYDRIDDSQVRIFTNGFSIVGRGGTCAIRRK